ncbi:MAG TPA: dockerin type I domain-containing protein [Candidatus Paceibacterota bacterium]|nr:dockerin type I domain-containing protein [Candidatus Paceibacterota bacterium]
MSAIAMSGFFISQAHATATVVINEFASAGSEWVELYNPTASDVGASTLTLTQLLSPSTASSTESTLPALTGTIPSHSFLAVPVTNLNDTGDSIGLYTGSVSSANLLDRVTYGNVYATTTYPVTPGLETAPASGESGYRTTDGGDTWAVGSPTKGFTNVPAPTVVNISTVAELRYAIEHQVDGQTWNIAAGTYGLAAFNDITTQGETGWYFPITVNNLTIKGTGNPTIYGTGYTTDGNWSTQNLISVFGNGVTIDGVTLMPKVEPNKAIEVLGSDTTIKNVTIEPNTLTDQSEYASIPNSQDQADEQHWGGSIYFNDATGTQMLENVTIQNGGISDHAPDATLTLTNVNLNYSTNVDWINGYRLATHGYTVNGTPKVVYHVDSTLNNIDSVIANLQKGDTIVLDSDITTDKQITIAQDDVTIDGNGHMLSAHFPKTDTSNNSALGIDSDGVTVDNLVVDGTGTNLHGINVFNANGITLNGVTVQNNGQSGLNIVSSEVTVDAITTKNNGWHGIDVDLSSGTVSNTSATLTVNGSSTHVNEIGGDIYVDDATKDVTVVDTNHQYVRIMPALQAHDAVYDLIPAAPTNERFIYQGGGLSCGDTVKSVYDQTLQFVWDDVGGDASQHRTLITYPDGTTKTAWTSSRNVWMGNITKYNYDNGFGEHGNGSYAYQVQSRDAAGVWSNYSPACTLSYDTQSPTAQFDPTPSEYVDGDFAVSGAAQDNVALSGVFFDVRDPSITSGNSWVSGCVSGTASSTFLAASTTALTACTMHTANLTEGHAYTLRIHAGDNAGYGGGQQQTLILDKTRPVAHFTAPANGSTQTGTFDVTGTATDTLSGVDHVAVYIEHDPWSAGGYVVKAAPATWDAGSGTFAYHASGIPDGTYDVKAAVFDKAGNVQFANPAPTITVVNVGPAYVTTDAATGLTSADAILNGTIGGSSATGHSFWVSTSTIDTSISNMPAGVYSTPDFGSIAANADFSASLSSLTTNAVIRNGVHSVMPAITPNTTYYYVAWARIGSTWHPGAQASFTTGLAAPIITSPANDSTTTVAGLQRVSWTASAGTGVTYLYQSSLSDATTTTGAFTAPRYTSSSLTTTYITTSGTPVGTYYLHVMAKDSNGKTSAWSPVVKVTVMAALPLTYTYATTTVQAADLAASLSDVMTNPAKWFFYSDTNDTIDDSLGSFVTGPGTAPAGSGSAQMTLGASPADRVALATYQFSGTLLADVKRMQYSLYEPTNAGAAPSLQFNVDLNGTDAWQHRLLYEPSENGQQALTLNSWNAIDAYQNGNALWTWSGLKGHGGNATQWPDRKTAVYRTWYDIVSSFPKARVRVTDSWLGFRIGSPSPVGYTSDVDKFVIDMSDGANATTTTYDFEPTAHTDENTPSSGGGAGGVLGDLDNDGKVDFRDFAIMMFAFGKHGANLAADLNHDGVVNAADFAILFGNWTE